VPAAGIRGDGEEDAAHVRVEAIAGGEAGDVLALEGIREVEALYGELEIVEEGGDVCTAIGVRDAEGRAALENVGPIGTGWDDFFKTYERGIKRGHALMYGRKDGGGDIEIAVPDAAAGDELIRDALERGAGALDEEDLEALMIDEEDVLAGDDLLYVFALDHHKAVLEAGAGVVIDEGDGAGHDLTAKLLCVLDELLAQHFANGVRATCVAAAHDDLAKFIGQGLRK
jgi:hypothetical protein